MKKIYIIVTITLLMLGTHPQAASAQIMVSKHQSQQATQSTAPSFIYKTWFKFKRAQKELNRSITQHMRDLKSQKNTKNMFFVLFLAFLYGVLHAFGPGHGKFVIISYFLSQNARNSRGILMGLRIAFLHVLSAILLVLITNNIATYILGGNAYKEIKIISYTAMLCIGLWMIYRTKKHQKNKLPETTEEQRKSEWLLSLSVGMIPCTGALIILFYAMSQQMIFLGISLVLAIACGIAASLSSIGVICTLTRSKITISENKKKPRIAMILEYAGALFIVLISTFLIATALL
ncbi:MAG: nickel/cobalt transporter [Alphaproteobacteria bacterium]